MLDRRIHSYLAYTLITMVCLVQAWQTVQIIYIYKNLNSAVSQQYTEQQGSRALKTVRQEIEELKAEIALNQGRLEALLKCGDVE